MAAGRYDFDCPTTFDLENFNNSGVDKWFDEHHEEPSGAAPSSSNALTSRHRVTEPASLGAPGRGGLAGSASKPTASRKPAARPHQPPSLTIPKSPKFAPTRLKSSTVVESTEDRELKETKKQFKATSLNKRILRPRAVNRVAGSAPTQAQSPNFSVEGRLAARKGRKRAAEEDGEECGGGQGGPAQRPVLKAKRLVKDVAPHTGLPFKDQPPKRKVTTPVGFPGLEREVNTMRQRRANKVQQALEEEKKAREFKAGALPYSVYTADNVPPVEKPSVTQPKPFDFRTDQRGSAYQEKFKSTVEAEEAEKKRMRVPRAQPASVLQEEPFIPKKGEKVCTVPKELHLNSSVRAELRQEQAHEKAAEAQKLATVHARMEEETRRQNDKERREQRKATVVKAKPVKKYNPLVIVPSDKQPTKAKAPRFRTRSQRRREEESLLDE